MTTLTARLVGGPTAVLEYGGMRFLTDPTFSPPGRHERLVKTRGPAIAADEVGAIDIVLLSHHHHADNLDPYGRAFLPRAEHVLTTAAGAEALGGNAVGLTPGDRVDLERPDGGAMTIIATPALHGPPGSEPVTGPVIGFVLSGDGLPTVYVSGDNASLDVVREIAGRIGTIDVAVLFAGAASVERTFDGAPLTLTGAAAAEAAEILGVRAVVPVHVEGWEHFGEDGADLRAAFERAGIADRLVAWEPGGTVTV
ncbi:MAG: MBL fold metallo-hydrolase [Thermoleophilia bacterium]